MEPWQALLLGVIEGVTEFLPVSSTGHLLVAQRLLGLSGTEEANAFVICIQVGALAAVAALYARRVRQIAAGAVGRDAEGRALLERLLIAFAPAAVVGMLAGDAVERVLFGPWPVVAAWVLGGVLILALSARIPWQRWREGLALNQLGRRQALIIGFAQCLALWPGTSRSLVTIVAATLLGLSLAAAIEFSFLLGALTLAAASAWTLVRHGDQLLGSYGATELLLGFTAAFVTAWLSVRWMVAWLDRHGLQLFGWWRVLAGGAVAAALVAGWL